MMTWIVPGSHSFQIIAVCPELSPISMISQHYGTVYYTIIGKVVRANDSANVRRAVYVQRRPVTVEKGVKPNIEVMAGGAVRAATVARSSVVRVERLNTLAVFDTAVVEHEIPVGPVTAPLTPVSGDGMEVVIEHVALDEHMSSRCYDTVAVVRRTRCGVRQATVAPRRRTIRIIVVVKVIVMNVYGLESRRIVEPRRISRHLARPHLPHSIAWPSSVLDARRFHGSSVPARELVMVDFDVDLVLEVDSFGIPLGDREGSPRVGWGSWSFNAHTGDAHVIAVNRE